MLVKNEGESLKVWGALWDLLFEILFRVGGGTITDWYHTRIHASEIFFLPLGSRSLISIQQLVHE